jgi:glycosyltransferase involved in cell wall biosynthesis
MHAFNRSHYRHFAEVLQKDFRTFQRVIVMESMPWDHPTKQRPHHLVNCLRDLGFAVIYINRGFHLPKKDSERIYVVDDQIYFRDFVRTFDGPKYFWLMSPTPVPAKVVREFLSYGLGLVYDHIDEFHETITGEVYAQLQNYADLPQLKPKLLIASAKLLFDDLRKKMPDHPELIFVPNAVDMNTFHTDGEGTACPEDLRHVLAKANPIVGYYGMMAPWLDYDLVNLICAKRQDLEFVFIGPDYMNSLSKLKDAKNVHKLGTKQYRQLPSYSKHFNCAIIPFERGEIAKSTSPVKLFEYMAMGLPTVCTADLRECEGYEHVLMSNDYGEFESNLDKAIELRKDPAVRSALIEQAKQNTWEARARAINEALLRIESASV